MLHHRCDLEQVPVHYVLATGGAHRLYRRDGRRGGGEGGRRVAVLLKNIIRTGRTLTQRQNERINISTLVKQPTTFSGF